MDKRVWPTGIRPSGNGIQIRIWRNRQIIYSETIKGDPHKSRDLAAAVKRRKYLESRLTLGLPVFDGDEGKVSTVASAAQGYLDTLDAKDSTHLGYERILNRYWLPFIGDWPVSDVRKSKIQEILAGLKVTTKTKRNILGPLRETFLYAGVDPNPASNIKLRKAQKPKVERYKPEQREKLLNALTDPECRLYYALLFGCGLRPRGEPLALQWSDYDGQELDISKQMTRRKLEMSTKTSHQRTVYVPQWVRPLLNNHDTRFEGGFIFQNSFGEPHRDADKFIAAWKVAHTKCRVPYRDSYKCRHTRASELLSQGVEPGDAAKQLGHSLEMFFRIYADFIEEFSKNKDQTRFEGVTVNLSGGALAKPLAK